MYLLKLTHPNRLPIFLETDDELNPSPRMRMKARYTRYEPKAITLKSGFKVEDRAYCGNEQAMSIMRKAWGVPEPKTPIEDAEIPT